MTHDDGCPGPVGGDPRARGEQNAHRELPRDQIDQAGQHDPRSQFWQRHQRPDNDRSYKDGRVLEAYHWGRFTSGSFQQALWLLLVAGLRVAIEAAGGFGWERYIGADGVFVGMTGFGASAPAPELYKHFGITAAAVVEQVKAKL